MRNPFPVIFFIGLLLISCTSSPQAGQGSQNPCPPGTDLLLTDLKDHYFEFNESTELRIDLDKDQKDDFEFVPRQSGNRIARMLRGLSPGHTVSQRPFLSAPALIDSNMVFGPELNLNSLDAELDNDYGTLAEQYFALRIEKEGEVHYGWIQFSTTDSTPGAPLYYGSLYLTLHASGYNRNCGALAIP